MPIDFACSACGKRFRAKDEWSGRAVACPQCKADLIVPTSVVVPVGTDSFAALTPIPVDLPVDAPPPLAPRPRPVSPFPPPSPWLQLLRPALPDPDVMVVRVVDVAIPFWSMVSLIARFALASALVGVIFWVILGGVWMLMSGFYRATFPTPY